MNLGGTHLGARAPTRKPLCAATLLRSECQQKAHQFCLPMCVGLIEDVLQVSLDCGHRKRQFLTDRFEPVTPHYAQGDVGLGIR